MIYLECNLDLSARITLIRLCVILHHTEKHHCAANEAHIRAHSMPAHIKRHQMPHINRHARTHMYRLSGCLSARWDEDEMRHSLTSFAIWQLNECVMYFCFVTSFHVHLHWILTPPPPPSSHPPSLPFNSSSFHSLSIILHTLTKIAHISQLRRRNDDKEWKRIRETTNRTTE